MKPVSLRRRVKRACNLIALALVSPGAIPCRLEQRLGLGHGCFDLWSHVFACLPGAPGIFLRRAFYRWTLDSCAEDVTIAFGTIFSQPSARLERGVYIGAYAIVGSAIIGENTLIGSRTSLLSGGHQHHLLPSGEWSATDEKQFTRIAIGRNTWVGEAAVLMADVGERCMVSAGAVVSSPVPSAVMVGGNPARFIKRLDVPATTPVPLESDANAATSQPAAHPVPRLA